MSEVKINKEKSFLKKYSYYIVVAIAVICIAVLVATMGSGDVPVDAPVKDTDIPVNNVVTQTFVLPVSNYSILKDYSDTELMYNSTLKQWEAHKAIDYSVAEGSAVLSVSAGKVENIYTNYMEGTVIVISHEDGLKSIYSSLNETTNVAVGDSVSAGQQIGTVSASAKAEINDGAHLHFEMQKAGQKVNPNSYFSSEEK